MAFNQRLIVVQIPINAREKRKRKKRSFAHFVFNFCSFRFCDYMTLSFYTLYIYVTIQHLRFDVAWCWTSEHVYGFCILLLCYAYLRGGRWKLKKI